MYKGIQKKNSAWNPAFKPRKHSSILPPKAKAIQSQPDHSSPEESIPSYSSARRNRIQAKVLQTMDAQGQQPGESPASEAVHGEGKSLGNNQLTTPELTHTMQQTGGVQAKTEAQPHHQKGPVSGALAVVSVGQSVYEMSRGGMNQKTSYTSYPDPDDTPIVPSGSDGVDKAVARFRYDGLVNQLQIVFNLVGEFGQVQQEDGTKQPYLLNVYFRVGEKPPLNFTKLTFEARAKDTLYGSLEDPKIEFVCTGEFTPAGLGASHCSYHAVLRIDSQGNASLDEDDYDFTTKVGDISMNTIEDEGFSLVLS